MTNFGSLKQEIDKHRKNAATFHKVDLHIHSFESHDYPKLGDKKNCAASLAVEDGNKNPQDFIEFAKRIEDLRLIAITDHNLCRKSVEIAKLSDDDLLALPGMEVTLKTSIFPDSNVHILAIFPESYTSEDIDKIFTGDSGMPRYDQRTHESVANIDIADFIKRVHNAKGICIAGHVNSNKGIRTLFRDNNVPQLNTRLAIAKLKLKKEKTTLSEQDKQHLLELEEQVKILEDKMQNYYLEFLSKYNFDAVEVQKSGDQHFYAGRHTSALGIKPIPCVLGSDAHNLQDIGLKGSTTYIKMQTPSFRDLRRALGDPSTRVRYEDTVPKFTPPRVLGVRFGGGFFETQTIGFSDNLSCLIGGRGSGKSATIEALRHIFEHRISHLTQEKQKDITSRCSYTLNGASVEVMFADQNDDVFILRRGYSESKTTCFTVDGESLTEVDVLTASNLDVKIYGWGEIEELAKNKREQLKLIDGFIPDIEPLKDNVNGCMRALQNNLSKIISLAEEIETLLPKIDELPQKRVRLERLSTKEIDAIFEDYDRNSDAGTAITAILEQVQGLRKEFLGGNDEPHNLKEKISTRLTDSREKLSAYEWLADLEQTVNDETEKLQERYNELMQQFTTIDGLIANYGDQLSREYQQIEKTLNEKIASDNEDDLSSLLTQRRRLSDEVTDLAEIENRIKTKRKNLDELLAQRHGTLLPALIAAQNELTSLRQEKIADINSSLNRLSSAVSVSIDLLPQGDREEFRSRLGAPEDKAPDGLLKNVNRRYKQDNYAGHFSRLMSPYEFVQIILEQDDSSGLLVSVQDEEAEHQIIDEERAKKVIEHLSPYLPDTSNQFSAIKLKQLLQLEQLNIEDLPIIKLDNKPIEDLSPGQRCSTLIPIILLESSSPLIIDQPEDNLDNKLVFGLVVDILRSLKQQRQIIVATHNPNIPVSGDAEQIIVYETSSRKSCTITHQGSIDDEKIVEHIKAIMEGSEDAFRIRAEKYGYQISII